MKKHRIKIISVAIVAVAIVVYLLFFKKAVTNEITVLVEEGDFEVTVLNTGELRAKNYTEISAPSSLRQVGIWQVKISNLITEGTVVKEGEFVAELDKTEIMNKINEEQLNVQKKQSEFKSTQLDTTLTMRDARDELFNLKYAVEERKLTKEQSIYEPPAVLRQAEIEYEKAIRNFEQKKENYKTKQQQSVTKMQIIGSELTKAQNRLGELTTTLSEFTITAPKSGMVIYAKEWDGKKRIVGSTVNSWDPTVANLPDLRTMESVTYINEVDIQKVKVNQKVSIGLDAQSGKKLVGLVKSVASIGEQKPNSEAKVFEVVIDVTSIDTSLRPAMTTANSISTNTLKKVLSVPIESVHNEGNKAFVYKRVNSKIVKQLVKTGASNETHTVVANGLLNKDEIFLSTPKDTVGITWVE
ncbi:MAG: efflux RND transporter periplasmic adaptor subunit [Candidatus Methylacidiphilales bacterium]